MKPLCMIQDLVGRGVERTVKNSRESCQFTPNCDDYSDCRVLVVFLLTMQQQSTEKCQTDNGRYSLGSGYTQTSICAGEGVSPSCN